jgi:hypothetical protein
VRLLTDIHVLEGGDENVAQANDLLKFSKVVRMAKKGRENTRSRGEDA